MTAWARSPGVRRGRPGWRGGGPASAGGRGRAGPRPGRYAPHRRRRRAAAWLAGALLLSSILLCGCWDRTELNDLAIVAGAAVDAAPGGAVRLTLSLVLPGGVSGGGTAAGAAQGTTSTTTVVSATGRSLLDAAAQLQKQVSQRLFWGHTRVVIVGGALAERGIAPVVSFFLRERTTSFTTQMLATPGEAGPLLQVSPPFRSISTNNVGAIVRLELQPRSALYRVAVALSTPTAGFLLPELEAVPAVPASAGGGGGGAGGGQGGSGGGQGAQSQNQVQSSLVFRVAGAAVFQGSRLRGWLSPSEAVGAIWVLGSVRNERTVLDTPDGAVVSLDLESGRTRRRALLVGGRPEIRLTVDATEVVREVDGGHLLLDRPNTLAELDGLVRVQIENEMGAAVRAVRGMGADAFGFGGLIARYLPRAWAPLYSVWPAAAGRVPVVLQVRADVVRTGTLVNGPQVTD